MIVQLTISLLTTLCLLLTSWSALAVEIEENDGSIYLVNDNGKRERVFEATNDKSGIVSYAIEQVSNSGNWAILYSIHTGYGSRASEIYFLYNLKHKTIPEEYEYLSGLEELTKAKYYGYEVLKLRDGKEIKLSEVVLNQAFHPDQFKLSLFDLFSLDISYLDNNGEFILDHGDSAGRGKVLGKVDLHIVVTSTVSGDVYSKKVYSINNPSGLLDDNCLKLDNAGNYTIYRGDKDRAIFFPNTLAEGSYKFQVFLQLENGERIYSNTVDLNLSFEKPTLCSLTGE